MILQIKPLKILPNGSTRLPRCLTSTASEKASQATPTSGYYNLWVITSMLTKSTKNQEKTLNIDINPSLLYPFGASPIGCSV